MRRYSGRKKKHKTTVSKRDIQQDQEQSSGRLMKNKPAFFYAVLFSQVMRFRGLQLQNSPRLSGDFCLFAYPDGAKPDDFFAI